MDNICNVCGSVTVKNGDTFVCPACGAIKLVDKNGELDTLLFGAMAKLRLAYFDEAEELYRDIISRFPTSSEGYFGLALSKFGIKFVEEDGKSYPTCYNFLDCSIMNDEDFLRAISFAKPLAKERYLKLGEKIDKIRETFNEKIKTIPDTDVFICYKDSDGNSVERTKDSFEAQNLYTYLIQKGYSVFFSRESLKSFLAEDYEPYIYHAINTAKVMIVLGSKLDYFESNWLKNEWERYATKIRLGNKSPNSLLVIYDGINPALLPKPLSYMQALDLNSKTCYIDLTNHIEKLLYKKVSLIERANLEGLLKKKKASRAFSKEIETRKIGNNQKAILADDESLLKLADKFIENGMFDNAKNNVELIENNPENSAVVSYYKLLILYKAKNADELIDKVNIEDFANLEKFISSIPENYAKQIIDALKNNSKSLLQKDNYEKAKECFDLAVSFDYKDRLSYISEFINLSTIKANAIDKENLEKIVSSIRVALPNEMVDEHIMLLNSFANQLKEGARFDEAREFYNNALTLEEYNKSALLGLIYCEIRLCDENNNAYFIEDLTSFDIIEKYLKCLDENEKTQFIEKLLTECVRENKNYNAIKTSEKRRSVGEVFDKLITYIPKESEAVLIDYLYKMADSSLSMSNFDNAEKYYALIASEDKSQDSAFLGLMKARLKVKSDYELTTQKVSISSRPEFNCAVLAVKDKDDKVKFYIDLAKKQDKFLKSLVNSAERESLEEQLKQATLRREREEERLKKEKETINATYFEQEDKKASEENDSWWEKQARSIEKNVNDAVGVITAKINAKKNERNKIEREREEINQKRMRAERDRERALVKEREERERVAREKRKEEKLARRKNAASKFQAVFITLFLAASIVVTALNYKIGLPLLLIWFFTTIIIVIAWNKKR